MKPGKKISDCDCYDLAAGGPTCMQGARFNTPSDTLVCSYRVALKLRKRTKKKHIFAETPRLKNPRAKPNKNLKYKQGKIYRRGKKKISILKNWKERHSHESEDDGSL